MGATLRPAAAGTRRFAVNEQSAVLAVFAATLFLSAFLLFSVQPMFAKMVLPKLGGSPSVWAVSTCFFQAILLAGYCYAHLLNRFVDIRFAPAMHLAVLAIACVALPIALPAAASEPPVDGAYGWLTGILFAGVGLPFFAVSANAPLLQAWFSRTGNVHAADPYFLYGASNFGSLLALLSYPLLIEPEIGLAGQASIWSLGFVALAFALAVSGLVTLAASSRAVKTAEKTSTAAMQSIVSGEMRARWVLYSAVPSGLLVAFTTHLSTDIAAVPFLWVLPLAVFLATFILVFRDPPLVPVSALSAAQPMIVLLAMPSLVALWFSWWQSLLMSFTAFLVTTLVAHRVLYESRPHASRLTEFYLWMSFGGVLGGLFAAIIAPQIFKATYEFPILLLMGMLCRPGVLGAARADERRKFSAIWVVCIGILTLGMTLDAFGAEQIAWLVAIAAVLISAVALVYDRRSAKLQAAHIAGLALVVIALPSVLNRGDPVRSFFGVLRVLEQPDGSVRLLAHGTTDHGAQRFLDTDGNPVPRPIPSTYYHPGSPMAKAVDVARRANTDKSRPFSAGIVGLGIGSMACYAKPDEAWRFYEIDQKVVDIATDPKRFTFLSTCQPQADIVLGDARLTVAKEPDGKFDYLQIDAFSSDSVPSHLLTTEALKLYFGKLSDNGVLAIHVSNRHLDLAPVAAAAALAQPGAHVAIVRSFEKGAQPEDRVSIVVLAAKSPAAFAPFRTWGDAQVQTTATVRPWTDDYSDVISAFWRRYSGH